MPKAKTIEQAIEVDPLEVGTVQVWLRGRTPLICNRMAKKAGQELLLPQGRKNKAVRESTLKHDPIYEFRNSMNLRAGNSGPTRLQIPSPAIKGAMATAALETKGTNKTQIGRLVWVENYRSDVYGIPKVFMSVVRSADMNKTPDIRTRAILEEWCVPAIISYVKPQMSERALFQLLANGGVIVGIGDFRQEKGKGNFGQFEVVLEDECRDIVKAGGRKQQDAAIKNPECFDADTEELLGWFQSEVTQRGKDELLSAESQTFQRNGLATASHG